MIDISIFRPSAFRDALRDLIYVIRRDLGASDLSAWKQSPQSQTCRSALTAKEVDFER